MILMILLGIAVLWAAWNVIIEYVNITVYVVWAIDDAEMKAAKFLGIAWTEWGAKHMIHDDQIHRWADLEKDKWRVEWRYDPVIIKL